MANLKSPDPVGWLANGVSSGSLPLAVFKAWSWRRVFGVIFPEKKDAGIGGDIASVKVDFELF